MDDFNVLDIKNFPGVLEHSTGARQWIFLPHPCQDREAIGNIL